MKIILSHDIDHLKWTEHIFKDTYIPKLIVRTSLQRIKKLIDTKTTLARVNFLTQNRLHRLDELIVFLKKENIRSTFFIAFANGLNLSYSYKEALLIGERLLQEGFAVGIHGIEYNNLYGIVEENLKGSPLLSKQAIAGIRMHYLRQSENMHGLLAKAGYHYDSTEYRIANPYKSQNGLWSFPIGVMDCFAVTPKNECLEIGKKYTLKLIEEAIQNRLNYFVINFHDVYFDDNAYGSYKEWLVWLVHYLKDRGHIFIDFETAITELQQGKS